MKISKTRLFHLFAWLALMPPMVITEITIIKNLLNIVQVIIFLVSLIKVATKLKRLSTIVFLAIAYSAITLVATLFGDGELYETLVYFINLVGFSFLFYLEVIKDKLFFLKNTRIYFEIIFCINFLYLIYSHYFLGILVEESQFITVDNSLTAILLFALIVAILDDYLTGKFKVRTLFFVIILTATELINWSGTGMVGFFIVVFYLIIVCIRKKVIRVPYGWLTAFAIVFFIAITFFGVSEKLGFFVEDVLQKDVTLTGRNVIWAFYFKEFLKSPLLGYGRGYTPYLGLFAHSGWLDILITGGILLMSLFVITLIYSYKLVKAHKDSFIANLIAVTVFAFEIMMVAEMPSIVYLWGLFMLLTYYVEIYNTTV